MFAFGDAWVFQDGHRLLLNGFTGALWNVKCRVQLRVGEVNREFKCFGSILKPYKKHDAQRRHVAQSAMQSRTSPMKPSSRKSRNQSFARSTGVQAAQRATLLPKGIFVDKHHEVGPNPLPLNRVPKTTREILRKNAIAYSLYNASKDFAAFRDCARLQQNNADA